MGLPWASTVMQASTAQKDLIAEGMHTKAIQRTAAVGAEKARSQIKDDLAKARARLSGLGGEADFAQQVEGLAEIVVQTAAAYNELERRLANAEDEAEALKDAASADEREARDIRETIVATSFFNGLQPTCCPRCEAAVTTDRIKREQTDFSCSVCTEPIPAEKMEDVNERLAEVYERAAATKAASDRAAAVVSELKEDLSAERKKMLKARADLGAAPASSGLRERRDAELEIARLEGMLEAHDEIAWEPVKTAGNGAGITSHGTARIFRAGAA